MSSLAASRTSWKVWLVASFELMKFMIVSVDVALVTPIHRNIRRDRIEIHGWSEWEGAVHVNFISSLDGMNQTLMKPLVEI